MPQRSTVLANVSWLDAQKLLTEHAVVVFASGNALKAHGPYLPLSTDFIQAEYVKEQVARDAITHICRSHARSSSARRFYVIAHGAITRPVFEQAAKQLELEGR